MYDSLNLRIYPPLEPPLQIQWLQKETIEKYSYHKLQGLQLQRHQYQSANPAIKRKIDVDKIRALTVSRIGTEFVIHVPEEYDYRYFPSFIQICFLG